MLNNYSSKKKKKALMSILDDLKEGDLVQLAPLCGQVVRIFRSGLISYNQGLRQGEGKSSHEGTTLVEIKLDDGRILTLGQSQAYQIQKKEV